MNDYKYIGKSYPIHDAEKKVCGETVYTGDIKLQNMLYARMLISPVGHGIIKNIDVEEAEKIEGVVKVFTHLNTPKKTFNRYRTISDQDCCKPDERILTDKVRFNGDRVAAVVARSPEIARKALEYIKVEYEELPVMINTKMSLDANASNIHDDGNFIHECTVDVGERVDIEDEDVVEIRSHIESQSMHHGAIETHSYLANYENGKLTIWTPTQGVYGVRTVVADLLDMKYNNVRVIKTLMGGSFGGKQEFPLEPLLAFIARETKSAVRLDLDRKESIISTLVRPENSTDLVTTFTKEGGFIDCKIDNVVNAGAYIGSSIDQIHGMIKKVTRQYKIPYYKHNAKAVYTNTPVAGGMRGWGSPEMLTPVEIHMDFVAKKLNMDPVEIRLKNITKAYDKDLASGHCLGNCQAEKCIRQGAEKFNWEERFNRETGKGRFLRGVGLAYGNHKNGMYGGSFPEYSTMTMTMNEDGSFDLSSTLHDVGCGTITSMQLIVAEVLDVQPQTIAVTEGDTQSTPYDFGSYGSRVTYVCGACAKKVAESVKEKILTAAMEILAVSKEDLQLRDGFIYSKSSPDTELSYKNLAKQVKFKFKENIISTEKFVPNSSPAVFAVHFAEVEVDTYTGLSKVTDYLAVQDIGKAINLGMVEGQVQGAVQMGIGYALSEEIKVNEKGIVTNAGFEKYNLVNAPDMPRVDVMLVEEGGDEGPFGAKSVGEISNVPVAAAVVNAVNNALGTELCDLPLTPDKILEALNINNGEI